MTAQVIEKSYSRWEHRETSKGSYPFVKPLPYVRHIENEYAGTFIKDHPTYEPIKAGMENPFIKYPNEHNFIVQNGLSQNQKNLVRNKALSKLQDELTIASNLFEAWYERREAYTMLGDALSELYSFARNWRNPAYYAKLGKKVKDPSSLPEAWLMYNFGIKPLVGTVDTVLHDLAEPLPFATFSGTSGVSVKGRNRGGQNSAFLKKEQWHTLDYLHKIGCTAYPNPNPNVGLANIGGLTTPFSTTMSVLPWGWAVEYFVNVQQLLSNVELVHPGVETMDYYETIVTRSTRHGSLYKKGYYDNGKYISEKTYFCMLSGDGYRMERRPIRKPRFRLTFDFPMLGSSKVANLSSALALTLKGKRS